MKGKGVSDGRRTLENKGVPPENIDAYLRIYKKLSNNINQHKKDRKVQLLQGLREEFLSWLRKAKGNGFKPDEYLFFNAFNDMVLKVDEYFALEVFTEGLTSGNFARHFLEHALTRDLYHITRHYHDKLVHDFMHDEVLPDDPDKNKDPDTTRRRRSRRSSFHILNGLLYYQNYLKRTGETLLDNLPQYPQGYLKEIAVRLQIIPPDPMELPKHGKIPAHAESYLYPNQEARFIKNPKQETQK